jgi:hypothetical protein
LATVLLAGSGDFLLALPDLDLEAHVVPRELDRVFAELFRLLDEAKLVGALASGERTGALAGTGVLEVLRSEGIEALECFESLVVAHGVDDDLAIAEGVGTVGFSGVATFPFDKRLVHWIYSLDIIIVRGSKKD